MRRSGPPQRKTPLTARTPMSRGQGLSRTPLPRTPSVPGPREAPEKRSGKAQPAREVPAEVRAFVYARDDLRCVRCGRYCTEGNRQLQHRVARGAGGRREHWRASALILLCGASATDPAGCHYLVESRPDQARVDGYRVPAGIDPEAWAVRRHTGERVWLLDSGWGELE